MRNNNTNNESKTMKSRESVVREWNELKAALESKVASGEISLKESFEQVISFEQKPENKPFIPFGNVWN